jgi:hypothetical protein
LFVLNLSVYNIQECATESCSRVTEEFLDQVQRKGDNLDKRMMYERKQHMHEKHLKVPPGWIIGTIKTELKLFEHDGTLDDLHNGHDKALVYWR